MTDLFKKAKRKMRAGQGDASAEREHPRQEQKTPVEKPVDFSQMLLEKTKAVSSKEDITQRVMKTSIPDEEESRRLYFSSIEAMKNIFEAYKAGGEINKDNVINIGRKIVNNILSGSQSLLKLFHELDSLEEYNYYNAVNVSILSVEIGITYKYNKLTLLDLAVIGLLHDMDLIKSKHITDKPEKLSNKELEEIKKHPLNAAIFVDNAFNFSEKMINAILQHHEREKGQGYPAGLTEGNIHELALIIGIADTYEAMMHSRPYKEKIPPNITILNIINYGKELFPNRAVKALVSRVGLYPVGTWVELNTGEICKVLKINSSSPLRPVVRILKDKDKNEFRDVRTVDLMKIPSLYIKQTAEEKGV
ncbi:MAG: HD domain-containing protein [Candidatus Omnitrophica bacterium]|nr:HD domain-containing protein [Candidatus Omnitrophota bacterium]